MRNCKSMKLDEVWDVRLITFSPFSCEFGVWVHVCCVCGKAHVCEGENVCMDVEVWGWCWNNFLLLASTLFIETKSLSQSQNLPMWLVLLVSLYQKLLQRQECLTQATMPTQNWHGFWASKVWSYNLCGKCWTVEPSLQPEIIF